MSTFRPAGQALTRSLPIDETSTTMAASALSIRGRRERHSRGRRPPIVSILGESLVTAGVLALLFVTWQLWLGDMIIGAEMNQQAQVLSQRWLDQPDRSAPQDAGILPQHGTIPALQQPGNGEVFGVMSIPRFGSHSQFEVAVGTDRRSVLDLGDVGHYPDTVMPGQVGNSVYAAHRWTSGDPFGPIDTLVIGDPIIIQTPDGWYTYRYRNAEYVQATQTDVLLPVPQVVGSSGEGRYLTLTSCAPKYNMRERIIAYATFESFTPTVDGAPASIPPATREVAAGA